MSTSSQIPGKKRVSLKTVPYTSLKTCDGKNTLQKKMRGLPKETERLHLDGPPFRFVIQYLVDTLPKLSVVRITPTQEHAISPTSREILKAHNVSLEIGHQVHNGWKEGDIRQPTYAKNKKFFLSLTKRRQEKFNELLALGLLEARLAARYFCLHGETYVPLRELREATTGEKIHVNLSFLSVMIHAVMLYLNPKLEVSATSRRQGEVLARRVERLRAQKNKDPETF